MWRDMHIDHFEPAIEGDEVVLVFRARPFDERVPASSEPIVLPLDRARTAPYERVASGLPTDEVPGVRISVLRAHVGITMTTVDIVIEGTDPTDLLVSTGEQARLHMGTPPGARRQGPDAFWKNWVPDASGSVTQTVSRSGSSMSVSLKAFTGATFTGRPATSPPPPPTGPQPLDEEPFAIRSLPAGQELESQGSSSNRSAGVPGTFHGLRFDAPSVDASSLELSVAGVYRFRYGGDEVLRLPGPTRGDVVDLRGQGFDWHGERIELLEWRRRLQGNSTSYDLWLRCSDPRLMPDVRVLLDDESTSLRMVPYDDGIHRGGRVPSFNALMERDEVPLALRMVGVPSDPMRLTIPLTASVEGAS